MRVIVQTPSTSSRNGTQHRSESVGNSRSGMGKEMQCKVKLVKGEGQEPEIRRFKLMEQHGPPSFVNLMIQIASIFPELQFGNFKVFWKDEHDELIAFSSDMELAAALDSIQGGLLNLTVKIEPGMMNMGGFPAVHIPPVPGFMPDPSQAKPQTSSTPGFSPDPHFAGQVPMGQFAFGAFPGQPNMFYGMGAGVMPGVGSAGAFGYQQQTGGPTAYSWTSTSNDANGSRQSQSQSQSQYQASTSKQQQPEPSKTSTKEPASTPTPTPAPVPEPAPDIRSSISRNQEKLEMLLRMKNLPSSDES